MFAQIADTPRVILIIQGILKKSEITGIESGKHGFYDEQIFSRLIVIIASGRKDLTI